MIQSPQSNTGATLTTYSKETFLSHKLILESGVRTVCVMRTVEGQEVKGREKIKKIWCASEKLFKTKSLL